MPETSLQVGSYVRVIGRGPRQGMVFPVGEIDSQRDRMHIAGEWIPMRDVEPCASTRNTKVGDTLVAVATSFGPHQGEEVEVLSMPSHDHGEVKVKWSNGDVTYADIYAFATKERSTSMRGLNLKKSFLSVDFGANTDPNLAISAFNGQVAVKRADGVFATYRDGQLTEVLEDLTLNMEGILYNFPATREQLRPGDLIADGGKYYFVSEVNGTGIKTVDPVNATNHTMVKVNNMFGINFYAKVTPLTSIQDGLGGQGGPLGNMLPLLLLGEGGSGGADITELLVLSQMMGGGQGAQGGMANMLPMMLLMGGGEGGGLLGGKGGKGGMMKTLMLSQMFGGGQAGLGGLFNFGQQAPAAAPTQATETPEA